MIHTDYVFEFVQREIDRWTSEQLQSDMIVADHVRSLSMGLEALIEAMKPSISRKDEVDMKKSKCVSCGWNLGQGLCRCPHCWVYQPHSPEYDKARFFI